MSLLAQNSAVLGPADSPRDARRGITEAAERLLAFARLCREPPRRYTKVCALRVGGHIYLATGVLFPSLGELPIECFSRIGLELTSQRAGMRRYQGAEKQRFHRLGSLEALRGTQREAAANRVTSTLQGGRGHLFTQSSNSSPAQA
ncbi:hypothetical protein NDU88_001212 [Pleurodeles waltl]|uniref:Uncharacterized protein n=1 Tax=Pleurodeles waltl TaxID=8319 RepID=A0AAV7Q9F4_PLEWA|nr:hypothetical protein NDU88_001212 [Pleurodeles waltl]